jgi:hypothetical protein
MSLTSNPECTKFMVGFETPTINEQLVFPTMEAAETALETLLRIVAATLGMAHGGDVIERKLGNPFINDFQL